ncbi:DUF2867 domain-containing protein [Tabrizicola sp.]|uniref:DUF2867 domain-containing protein n=1 Tax=Tabrizicola sp. TaxID=2005166 RepID=UPI00286D37C8|nr:DUF2867 domain-containing protein [Tabrizicola sp.]
MDDQATFAPAFPAPLGYPQGAVIVAPQQRLAFLHQGRTTVPGSHTAADIWRLMMARPIPGLRQAFWLRDAISARFGVARIGGFSGTRQTVTKGGKLDFFLVEDVRDGALVLTARDRHLDVMISITATPAGPATDVGITASVITHNAFGRAYMLPVAPAHKWIVAAMLGRMQRAA